VGEIGSSAIRKAFNKVDALHSEGNKVANFSVEKSYFDTSDIGLKKKLRENLKPRNSSPWRKFSWKK